MSRKSTRSRNHAASRAATLLFCVAACWLLANFVVAPARQLSAGANDQPEQASNITLGVPTFGSADFADQTQTAAETSWQTPGQQLQLIAAGTGTSTEPSGDQILIRPRYKSQRSQPTDDTPFRQASQSAAQAAGLNLAQAYQERQKLAREREEWSVPGSFDPWRLAQSSPDENQQPPTADSSAAATNVPEAAVPAIPAMPAMPTPAAQSNVGSPQPISGGVAAPESTKELQPVQGQPMTSAAPQAVQPAQTSPLQNAPLQLPVLPEGVPAIPEVPTSPLYGQQPILETPRGPAPQAAAPQLAQPQSQNSPPPVYVPPTAGYNNYSERQLPQAAPFQNPGQSVFTEPAIQMIVPGQEHQVPMGSLQLQMPAPQYSPPVGPPQHSNAQTLQAPVLPQYSGAQTFGAPVPWPPAPQFYNAPYNGVPQVIVPDSYSQPYSQGQQYNQGVPYTPAQPHSLAMPQMAPNHINAPMNAAPVQSSPVYSPSDFGHSIQPQQLFGHSTSGSFPGTSGFRATVESDANYWMAPYSARVMNAPSAEFTPVVPAIPEIPAGFTPWWDAAVQSSVGAHPNSHRVSVSSLLQDALVHSPQVVAIKTEPEVQYRVITQEAAKFDWTAFLEATYDDLNDPVGSDLTTGNGEDRLLTRKAYASGGFRRRNLEGGELRIAQDLGHENQNSRFFVPNNQGSTRLELSYRQPLLDGAGRAYNESEIVLARIAANTSEDEVVDALQSHLTKVTEAYWTLYRARAEFFQRQKLLASAKEVLIRLEGRSQVDTIPRQILRSRAAVARSQTRIQRTLARVQDAEAQLRLLVNSPEMLNGGQVELMPTEAPRIVTESSNLQAVLQTALVNRPDISEAIRKMRAAGVRLGVSRTELLPRMDFLVEAYVADLAGNSNIGQAFRGQLLDNRPGYTVGLEFEVPIGNRAAIAKLEQREWELKRSVNIFRATVEKSLTDVEIANREVQTAYSEILSRYQSMKAADQESRYLKDRFEVLPAAEDSATLLLEDLLDSFERLADEESAFVQAQVDHAVALIKLKKELGTLLRSRNSRPQLDGEQEVWMSQRLGDSGAVMQPGIAVEGAVEPKFDGGVIDREVIDGGAADSGEFAPISSSRTLPSAGHQFSTPQSIPRTTGLMPEQAEGYKRSETSGVPIPLTPTTWRRPRSSLLGGN